MSGVRVRQNKQDDAKRVFDEMWNGVTVNSDGGFPYPDFFAVDDYLPLLDETLDFPSTIAPQERVNIISQSFTEKRRSSANDFGAFLATVQQKASAIMALREQVFYMTTSISYQKQSAKPAITKRFNQSSISICSELPGRSERINGFSMASVK